MEEQKGINLSEEQFRQLLDAFGQPRMNPLEQKRFDEEMKRDKRRALLAAEIGGIEAMSRYNRQRNCSHCRDPRTGNPCARGQGEWRTGGQIHGDDTATMMCLYCGTTWRWATTAQEREYINNAGMLGMAPPPIERCINKEHFMPPQVITAEKKEELSA